MLAPYDFLWGERAQFRPCHQIALAISRYRQNAFASMIWRGVLHSTWNNPGLATSTATHRARDTATLSRFNL
jgi:hypothetical protein